MTSEPEMVGGRYQLGDLLGRGGMAEVRRAIDTRLGRPVAVKQLRADLATDPTFQARFRREAQSAAGLNHPTIVAVYDTGEEPDPITGVSVPYIVMELVEGPTLRDVLRDGRKILPERALELTQGVLDALSYSHKAGIVHRDIKPANVMLTPTGGVKVMDFGIARAVADTSATMTQTAAVIGTAQYLSPEQARGETVDARSDIYSAGCLLYELLVGRPPFVGDSPVSVAYQHVREIPVPPSELDPVITPEIDAITLKALAKSRTDRYQSAREMKADITRLLAGQQVTALVPAVGGPDPDATRVVPVVSAPVSAPEPPIDDFVDQPIDEEEPKRRTGLAIFIVGLVVVVLAAAAFGLWQFMKPPPVPPPPAQIAVPSVIGFNSDQASSMISNAGLVPDPTNVNGPDGATVGTVTKQDPLGSSMVDPGATVSFEVNVGPKSAKIPNGLDQMNVDDAERALNEAGFEDVNKVKADPATEPIKLKKDDVVSVDPAEGTVTPLDSEIELVYATGNSVVPELSGRVFSVAETDAEAKGFKIHPVEVEDAEHSPGVIFDQKPKPGEIVSRDTEIDVWIPKEPVEPPPTPTPTPTASDQQSPGTPGQSPGGTASPGG